MMSGRLISELCVLLGPYIFCSALEQLLFNGYLPTIHLSRAWQFAHAYRRPSATGFSHLPSDSCH
ncbi:hypothetical protein I7I48_05940 [Histoplasma ohiense]|nr:hypothetical protein I7I48_05940 [Histoplasma ohiense (nom. inval.)]